MVDNCFLEICFVFFWGGSVIMVIYDVWESVKVDFKSLLFCFWKLLLDMLGLIDVNLFFLFIILFMVCWEIKDVNWGDFDRKIIFGDRLVSFEGCCWRYFVIK